MPFFYLVFVALSYGRSYFISIPSDDAQDFHRMDMHGKFEKEKKGKEILTEKEKGVGIGDESRGGLALQQTL